MNILGFISESRFEAQASVPVSATGTDVYSTPDVLQAKLKSVSNLLYKNGTFAVAVRLGSAASAGAVTVRLTDGTKDYASLTLDLTTGVLITASQDVDLSGVSGQTKLYVAVDVGTAAVGVTTITADAALQLEMPTTIMGC